MSKPTARAIFAVARRRKAARATTIKALLKSAMEPDKKEEEKKALIAKANAEMDAMADEDKKADMAMQSEWDGNEHLEKLKSGLKAAMEAAGSDETRKSEAANYLKAIDELEGKARKSMSSEHDDASNDAGLKGPDGADAGEMERIKKEIADLEQMLQGLDPASPEYTEAQAKLEQLDAQLDELEAAAATGGKAGAAGGKKADADGDDDGDEVEMDEGMKSQIAAMRRDIRRKHRLLLRNGIQVELPKSLLVG